MKRAFLLLMILVSGCGGDPSGSYDGTLTITMTGTDVVADMEAYVLPDSKTVALFSYGDATEVTCNLGGLSWSGSDAHFECGSQTCSCTIDTEDSEVATTSLTITTASGKLEDGALSLTFSGEVDSGGAFSATFEGGDGVDNI